MGANAHPCTSPDRAEMHAKPRAPDARTRKRIRAHERSPGGITMTLARRRAALLFPAGFLGLTACAASPDQGGREQEAENHDPIAQTFLSPGGPIDWMP